MTELRKRTTLLTVLGLIVLISVVAFLLRLVPSADITRTQAIATLTVADSTGTRKIDIPNLYTMRLTPGEYTIESTTPAGRTVTYSPCTNCTNHSEDSYTYGSRAKFSVSQGSYIDLIWWYPPSERYSSIHKFVDCLVPGNCDQGGGHGGIAPVIVKKDNDYHLFYCSAPDDNSPGLQDFLRYKKSSDGIHWSEPKIVVRASYALGDNGLKADKSACDPALVFYQGYYYLYYGNAYETGFGNNQTVISVARSATIDGPYLKYTKRGTWEENPPDTAHIIKPITFRGTPDEREGHFYGAGQPSVVVKDGKLLMWYLDDSVETFIGPDGKDTGISEVYMLESTNPVAWTPSLTRKTNLHNQHGDFRYDSDRNVFINFREALSHSRDARAEVYTSADGMTWDGPVTLIPKESFPDFANNSGVSSDLQGWLLPDESVIFSFAAPYDLIAPASWGESDREENWGNWDIFGLFYNIRDALLTDADRTRAAQPVVKPTTENQLPIGTFDFIDSAGVVFGWALDPDYPSQAVQVAFYLDKPATEGGVSIGTTTANKPSQDVTNVTHYEGNHRFEFVIPEAYRDGKSHQVYAYAYDAAQVKALSDISSDQLKVLFGSPKNYSLGTVPTPIPLQPTPTLPPATPSPSSAPAPVTTPIATPTPTPSFFCRISRRFCPKQPTPKPSPTPTITPSTTTQVCRKILFWTYCRRSRRPNLYQ